MENKFQMKTCFCRILLALFCLGNILACSTTGNPLLDATEAQFMQALNFKGEAAWSVTCDELLFFNKTAKEPMVDNEKNCLLRIRQRATLVGIPKQVNLEDVKDSRVKERYLALKKK